MIKLIDENKKLTKEFWMWVVLIALALVIYQAVDKYNSFSDVGDELCRAFWEGIGECVAARDYVAQTSGLTKSKAMEQFKNSAEGAACNEILPVEKKWKSCLNEDERIKSHNVGYHRARDLIYR